MADRTADHQKKIVAAVSAVVACLQEEAAAVSAGAAPARPQDWAARSRHRPNGWGLHGRQNQMQWRSLMQLKGFAGWRAR